MIRICKKAIALYTCLEDNFPIIVTGREWKDCWERADAYDIKYDVDYCIYGYILSNSQFISSENIKGDKYDICL